MVISSDLYVKSTTGSSAASPDEALSRLVERHYPAAPRGLFTRAQEDAGRLKYHVRARGGPLLASFLVASLDGEYYVEELALCEATAKAWSR